MAENREVFMCERAGCQNDATHSFAGGGEIFLCTKHINEIMNDPAQLEQGSPYYFFGRSAREAFEFWRNMEQNVP